MLDSQSRSLGGRSPRRRVFHRSLRANGKHSSSRERHPPSRRHRAPPRGAHSWPCRQVRGDIRDDRLDPPPRPLRHRRLVHPALLAAHLARPRLASLPLDTSRAQPHPLARARLPRPQRRRWARASAHTNPAHDPTLSFAGTCGILALGVWIAGVVTGVPAFPPPA